jgi:hypothetical protein
MPWGDAKQVAFEWNDETIGKTASWLPLRPYASLFSDQTTSKPPTPHRAVFQRTLPRTQVSIRSSHELHSWELCPFVALLGPLRVPMTPDASPSEDHSLWPEPAAQIPSSLTLVNTKPPWYFTQSHVCHSETPR